MRWVASARIAGAALCLLTGGCTTAATAPDAAPASVTSHRDPEADFSRYRTYAYLEPLDTDELGGGRSQLSTLLIEALDRELESRGYRRTAEDPDLQVNFTVQTRTEQTLPPSGPPPRYQRGRYRQWRGHSPQPLEYTEGTLSIDVIDASSQTVVWEGLAQGPLRGAPEDLTAEQVQRLVERIFEGFPEPARR